MRLFINLTSRRLVVQRAEPCFIRRKIGVWCAMLVGGFSFAAAPRAVAADCAAEDNKPIGCGTKYACFLVTTLYGSETEDITIGSQVRDAGMWITTKACDCRYVVCGRQRQCPDVQFTRSREEQVCWTFGGELTVEAKLGLLPKLLAELGASISIDVSRSGCVTVGQAVTFAIPWQQCFDNHGRDVLFTRSGTAIVKRHEVTFRWLVTDMATGEQTVVDTHCNTTQVGSVQASCDQERQLQVAPYPEECGSHVEDPDPYDSKRARPCCRPVPECDSIDPPATPCCGCEAGFQPAAGGR